MFLGREGKGFVCSICRVGLCTVQLFLNNILVNKRQQSLSFSHVLLVYYTTPHSPRPSYHSHTVPSTSYDMLFSSHHDLSVTHVPSHLNRFHFTTSDTKSIHILFLSSALYPSEIHVHHTSIVPSSSLSAPILHSAPHSLPMSHFHTPSHSSNTYLHVQIET